MLMLKPTTQRVFINENLTKKINSCFTWLMTKEKDWLEIHLDQQWNNSP